MRVRVQLLGPHLASVHLQPSWWEVWREERDDFAIGVPASGDSTAWCWDSTGRVITDRRILAALERARRRNSNSAPRSVTA